MRVADVRQVNRVEVGMKLWEMGAAETVARARVRLQKANAGREKKRVKQQKARADLLAAQAKVADAGRTNG